MPLSAALRLRTAAATPSDTPKVAERVEPEELQARVILDCFRDGSPVTVE